MEKPDHAKQTEPKKPGPAPMPQAPPISGDKPTDDTPSLKTGIRWRLAISLVAVLLIAIFAVQNFNQTEISFLWWDWDLPLAVLIVLVVVLSVLADEFITFWVRHGRRRK